MSEQFAFVLAASPGHVLADQLVAHITLPVLGLPVAPC